MYADDLSRGCYHGLADDGGFAAHDAVDRTDADTCCPSPVAYTFVDVHHSS